MTSSAGSSPTPSAADAECLALTRRLRRRGTVVLSLFTLARALAGASATGSVTDVVPLSIVVAALGITAGALYLGLRKDARPSPRTVDLPENWARGAGVVNALELLAVIVVVAAAHASGRPAFVPAGIALVVGLHFFPLARLYDQWQYRWTGALTTAVAAVGAVPALAGPPAGTVQLVVGLACAAVLWVSACHLAVRG
ncbi:hypothetical protein ACF1FC_26450 [Streptomyces sp. NPDC014344]|uniref:hypothetical protein n=1 Tax=Streptomyces sp. NPDC014344 TaxID=3364871 RepID=UPI0036F599CC